MRTGSSSLNFFQAVFTQVLTSITKPPPAESMSQVAEGSSSTTSSLSGPTWTSLCGQCHQNRAGISHALEYMQQTTISGQNDSGMIRVLESL